MATKLNKTAKKQKAHTRKDTSCMEIIGGRVHNLKNVNLRLPHGKLIVVTGVSGSGKSSLIFHLLYAEAHRRYLSTLESTFVQNMVHTLAKPDVDKISGLQAVVGIGQELTRSNSPRSTVGTLTDIYTFLRLLYARVADAYSPTTGKKMVCQTEREIQDHILSHFENKEVAFMAPIASGRRGGYKMLFAQLYKNGFTHVIVNDEEVKIYPNMELHRYHAHDIKLIVASNVHITKENISKIAKYTQETLSYGKGCLAILAPDAKPHYYSRFLMDDAMMGTAYRKPTANTFSFNSPYGACPRCQGLGIVNEIDQAKLIPDPRLSIAYGGIPLLGSYKPTSVFKRIESFLNGHGYNLRTPIQDIEADVMSALLYGRDPQTQKKVKINLGQVLGKRNKTRDSQEVHAVQVITCPLCEGKRLHKEALHFKIHGKDITEVSQMSLEDLAVWLKELPHQFSARQAKIASELLGEINKRVKLLLDMRLHYLSLNRPLYTLSGGEIRRSRIASHIGTQDAHLVGVLYILDEPTMNLHMRDIHNLIAGLRKLKNLGNSIVLSEHNKAMMLAADYLVELGPGAGQHGGTIVATGPPKKFLSQKSVTGDFLNEKETIGTLAKYRKKKGKSIVLRGCTGNNLKNVTLTIPLGKLIA
ncbi:MAG: excinuclease ABC subunit UvrA, partial [Bacteroidota bacterium]